MRVFEICLLAFVAVLLLTSLIVALNPKEPVEWKAVIWYMSLVLSGAVLSLLSDLGVGPAPILRAAGLSLFVPFAVSVVMVPVGNGIRGFLWRHQPRA